jgi:AAA+ ATPase superfamily predicted ATPase
VGRSEEQAILAKILKGSEPEFLALYGRRRVGKTFLIREFFRDAIRFELTGIHDAPRTLQLRNFSEQLGRATGSRIRLETPADWYAAFGQLTVFLESLDTSHRHVVFFDEIPWLSTRRSGFLQALEHFWNSWASRQSHIVLVICGSAAAWMIEKVIHNRGGLYNRVTRRIRLDPFTLTEVREFLTSRKVRLEPRAIIELFMALGGIPHYLKEVEPGRSAAQNIDAICFSPNGLLAAEFSHLYAALFDHPERHLEIIRALASRAGGLTRTQLLDAAGRSSGGRSTATLEELVESGFVRRIDPWERSCRDAQYRLADEFSLFYLRWMESQRRTGEGTWRNLHGTPAWRAWSGYAFENVVHRHVAKVKQALGIAGVETTQGCWLHRPTEKVDEGTQIDLLIDRRDDVINLCEVKFADGEFVIDKQYAQHLRRKLDVFRRVTQTRKSLFLTMVTTFGVRKNSYATDLVANEITMDDLF